MFDVVILNLYFFLKLTHFPVNVHVLYCAYIAASYISEYASIYKMLSHIFFSLLFMGLSENCEPKTPFKFEHGLHLDQKYSIKIH